MRLKYLSDLRSLHLFPQPSNYLQRSMWIDCSLNFWSFPTPGVSKLIEKFVWSLLTSRWNKLDTYYILLTNRRLFALLRAICLLFCFLMSYSETKLSQPPLLPSSKRMKSPLITLSEEATHSPQAWQWLAQPHTCFLHSTDHNGWFWMICFYSLQVDLSQ